MYEVVSSLKILGEVARVGGCSLVNPVPVRDRALSVSLFQLGARSRYRSRCSPRCSEVIMHQGSLEESVPKVREVVAEWVGIRITDAFTAKHLCDS